MLVNGRVERVDFSTKVPWPAPRPRPGAASAAPKKVEPPIDFWVPSFDEAAREAIRRNARILVLFTGPDWSPASKSFRDEVEFHPDFINTFTGDFVFLRLEFASRSALPVATKEENNRLRERYGVTTYPTLLVLSPDGAALGRVDLEKPQPGNSYRERVIAAVGEVRALLRAPVAATPAPADPAPPAAPNPPPSSMPVAPDAVSSSLYSAGGLVLGAIIVGLLIAGVLGYLVWRQPRSGDAKGPAQSASTRISDAASGLPTAADVRAWPREKVRAIVTGLAESDGFTVEPRAGGDEPDLVLRRANDHQPGAIVYCAAGAAGPVTAKRVRELFGSVTAEGARRGWYVAPSGFAPDARAFADQHGMLLLDAEGIRDQLRDLPPVLLARVLSRIA